MTRPETKTWSRASCSTSTASIVIPMGAQVSFGTYSGGTPTWDPVPLNPGQ
jgi:hypothetical protein